jgi:hypothetical protein
MNYYYFNHNGAASMLHGCVCGALNCREIIAHYALDAITEASCFENNKRKLNLYTMYKHTRIEIIIIISIVLLFYTRGRRPQHKPLDIHLFLYVVCFRGRACMQIARTRPTFSQQSEPLMLRSLCNSPQIIPVYQRNQKLMLWGQNIADVLRSEIWQSVKLTII